MDFPSQKSGSFHRDTRLVTGAGGATLEGSVCFSSEVVVAAGTFIPSQVLNFGSLAYVANFYIKLHHLKETALVDNESLASCPPSILLGADLKVFTR